MTRTPQPTGYSGTPLIKKLGLKEGFRAYTINAPSQYAALLGELPDGVVFLEHPEKGLDFIHLFARERKVLAQQIETMKPYLASSGMLWVSWPKKTSSLETDLNGNVVREVGLAAGLVDVKVCAVDSDWSGLKFVYRLKDR